jgi:hypothetical protein
MGSQARTQRARSSKTCERDDQLAVAQIEMCLGRIDATPCRADGIPCSSDVDQKYFRLL